LAGIQSASAQSTTRSTHPSITSIIMKTITLFRLVSLLTISHVALPVPCNADTQKKTKTTAPKYATQRAAFAAKLPEFDAAWEKAVGDTGSPDPSAEQEEVGGDI
jgi:hypothetical protein